MKFGGLLDQLLQGGQNALRNTSVGPRTGNSGQANPLSGILGGIGGGAAAAGAIGLLMGSKKARKVGGKVLTYGGLAAIGLMAYKALSNRRQAGQAVSNTRTAIPAGFPFRTVDRIPESEAESHEHAVLRAIIAAAKADGHIDDNERQIIDEGIAKLTGDRDILTWFDQELRKPLDPAEIARAASTPEIAAEMYLASLIVIDQQNFMERAYLDELARQMKIDSFLQRELENQARQHGG
ncbi:MAG TPA: tellurite resistance TerB family protein [Acidobacteriota bacterium]|nr:tellurite resistance TerB family protein [Acidobacteriota bacterium]